jgi:hypothetical protein
MLRPVVIQIVMAPPGRIGGWFEGRGLSTSRVSPPGPLSLSLCPYFWARQLVEKGLITVLYITSDPARWMVYKPIAEFHRPQKLKRLISLCANPASISSVPIQTVR